jgi:hypothetical protein
MAVRLALHIRGLPSINFQTLQLVAAHLLGIPTTSLRAVLHLLGEVEFIKLDTEGRSIKGVLPLVPYYETLYSTLGTYALESSLNEAEQLSLDLLCRLAQAPEKLDTLHAVTGAERKLLKRTLELGEQGAYLRKYRSRGRDIVLTPTYFSENAEIYADMVAGTGSKQVQKLITALRQMQGVPLSIVQRQHEIAGTELSPDEIQLLIRLAQDGAVKPPSISTSYQGDQYFLFTPTPSGAALPPTKRDIYERAMAIVAAVRQGQFLPHKYAIRSPGAVLFTLKNNLKLGKATTEATQQYRKVVVLRVARLINLGNGFSELQIIDTAENREALEIAYNLVTCGVSEGTEVDQEARNALQKDYTYIESLVASGELHRRTKVELTQQQQLQVESLFLR